MTNLVLLRTMRPNGSSSLASAQGIGMVILFPVAFVSTCFAPSQGMPGWMRVIADWNPVSAVAGACRELFGNPNPAKLTDKFPAQHPVFVALT
jgi:ABC-2 type transport system permease protein